MGWSHTRHHDLGPLRGAATRTPMSPTGDLLTIKAAPHRHRAHPQPCSRSGLPAAAAEDRLCPPPELLHHCIPPPQGRANPSVSTERPAAGPGAGGGFMPVTAPHRPPSSCWPRPRYLAGPSGPDTTALRVSTAHPDPVPRVCPNRGAQPHGRLREASIEALSVHLPVSQTGEAHDGTAHSSRVRLASAHPRRADQLLSDRGHVAAAGRSAAACMPGVIIKVGMGAASHLQSCPRLMHRYCRPFARRGRRARRSRRCSRRAGQDASVRDAPTERRRAVMLKPRGLEGGDDGASGTANGVDLTSISRRRVP